MDVPIEQDDLNQKFLSSLAPKWLVYTIVWRNRDDLDTMSLVDAYNHLKVYEPKVQTSAGLNSQNMAFISSSNTNSGKSEVSTVQGISTFGVQVSTASTNVAAASLSYDTICAFIATQGNGSQIKYEDITQIDNDDIKEIDIKWNLALLSMRADRSPMSQDRGKKESYKKDPKVEEPAPKAMIAIDGIRWDWSYMAEEDENHALVADEEEVPTEYALMAKSSSSSDNEVYDDSFCSKSCRKNTENLNNKIIKLNEELSDCETDLYNYKRGLSQVEARLVEFKENEIKFYERIRVLERDVEMGLEFMAVEDENPCSCWLMKRSSTEYALMDKEVLSVQIMRGLSQVEARLVEFKNNEIKLCGRIRVLKRDLELRDNKIENLRNELEEYSVVPPPPAQVYLPPKKDLSWMGLPEFVDDTVTDYSRPTPSIDVSKDVSDEQKTIWKSNSASFSEQGGSVGNVVSKPMIRFVKETGCPSVSKVNNTEKSRKPTVKYAKMYRSQRPRGNQRNWNSQKPQKLGSYFVMIKKACYMDAQTQGRHEHAQEFDVEITTVGAEVDDIAAKT
ncbi:hypothetical protein Tco_0925997 [Tanacetum coccineum]|uniref:Uncharacterized protein n=1 Tax=Tanacetum coccineum TaxID=301880 RepID=A0ABQ5DB96_9ASTR